MRLIITIGMILFNININFSQFTFNDNVICEKVEGQFQDELFFKSQVIPALSYFNRHDQPVNYKNICKCTDIENFLLSNIFYTQNDKNLVKQEAKIEFEKIHLSFLRKYDNKEWSEFFYKKITSDLNIIKVASKFNDFFLEKNGYELSSNPQRLKKEIISSMKQDIIYASQNCYLLNDSKKHTFNEYIEVLSKADPLVHIYSCE